MRTRWYRRTPCSKSSSSAQHSLWCPWPESVRHPLNFFFFFFFLLLLFTIARVCKREARLGNGGREGVCACWGGCSVRSGFGLVLRGLLNVERSCSELVFIGISCQSAQKPVAAGSKRRKAPTANLLCVRRPQVRKSQGPPMTSAKKASVASRRGRRLVSWSRINAVPFITDAIREHRRKKGKQTVRWRRRRRARGASREM